jgi:hypothetical protein
MAPAPSRIFTRVNSGARRLLIDAFSPNIGRIDAFHTGITAIQFGIFAISRKSYPIAQDRARVVDVTQDQWRLYVASFGVTKWRASLPSRSTPPTQAGRSSHVQ